MRGRRTVWSDAKVRELSRRFVLAADEVWRLQGGWDAAGYRARGGDDPECLLFQAMAAAGHYGPGAGSKQGIYVCTPAGKLLASVNSSRPAEVAAMLARGLQRWQALTDAERRARPARSAPKHRFEWLRPPDALVLDVTLRYLPADDDPRSPRLRDYNHDTLWLTGTEARRLLPADCTVGARHRWPEDLFQRLARYNLVDAVRGETRPFPRATGAIHSEVIAADAAAVTIRLTGDSRATGQPEKHDLFVPLGIAAQLRGTARFDRRRQRFTAFELVGKGIRWVRPRPDRRRPQGVVQPIGWLFTLAPAGEGGPAPTHIRSYPAGWHR